MVGVFERSLRDRLKDFPFELEVGNEEDLISQIATDLEESCRLASFGVRGLSEVQTDDPRMLSRYVSFCSTFITHLSPHFYTARHSFIYRDLLLRNQLRNEFGEIPNSINIVLQEVRYLWPEIFDNPHLTQADFQIISETRMVEIALVNKTLHEWLKTEREELDFSTEMSKSLQTVCMGKGQQCWKRTETKVIIPCGQNDATCNFEKTKFCMPYEDFLMYFATNDMQGDVIDPSDLQGNSEVTHYLDPLTTRKIRKVWFKELCMARAYLDIISISI